ncbi:DUF2963 domain-containing protein [Candidatus Phytoplasma solani]|uniref:DUF2963 domain-containing protein n=1 Tax=Candidatus Phytoplasma solani TaxID=69896 RepID=UPI00358DE909
MVRPLKTINNQRRIKKMQKAKEYQTINYQSDGKTINFIEEFNPNTGKIVKATIFQQDGTTVDFISDFDPSTGELVKKTFYQSDGTIIDIINF